MTHVTQTLFTERSRSRLLALCTHLGGRDAAEDLVQETLLEAWRQSHKLTDPLGGDAWLAAIARNVWRRWLRAGHRQARVQAAATQAAEVLEADAASMELNRLELADVLDSALQVLPPVTREALVRRFVDGTSHAHIATRLGLSAEAVSMRISRGRLILRRALESHEPELLSAMGLAPTAASWRRTRLACPICGTTAVDVRASSAPPVISFRCTGCVPDGSVPSSVFALDNPTWAELLEGMVRPSALLRRASRFMHDYFNSSEGADGVRCTRCSAPVQVSPYERPETDAPHRRGVYTDCHRCGELASVSAAGRALGIPELQAFQRAQPRIVLTQVSEMERDGVDTLALTWRSPATDAHLDILLTRDRLQPLDTPSAA